MSSTPVVRGEVTGGEIVRLWVGLLGPPVIWLCDLTANYALTRWSCANDRAWVLDAVSLLALVLVALTSFVAWGEWKKLGERDAGETIGGRRRLMAIGGLTNGGFFAVVIVATAIPNFVLRSCP